ncbi:MAG TPA: BrnA antitoxin family protein [Gemmatimonadaceae bacterium]
MRKRSGSSARGARVAANVRRTARRIDYSDIPESSPEQLRVMRRVGRPPLGDEPRQLIAIRVDPDVLDRFRKEARRRRVGYQTLINEVLAQHVRKDVA